MDGEVALAAYEIHDIANALKRLLRQLPEPLIPYSAYADFVKAARVRVHCYSWLLWTVVHFDLRILY